MGYTAMMGSIEPGTIKIIKKKPFFKEMGNFLFNFILILKSWSSIRGDLILVAIPTFSCPQLEFESRIFASRLSYDSCSKSTHLYIVLSKSHHRPYNNV
jgi:hypothetical protein